MVKTREYSADDKMISLISNDYKMLQVLSRFGIPLGFSDKTIQEVCTAEGVDCNTFLTVVNFLNQNGEGYPDIRNLSLKSLLHYLKQSHIYFLDFYLPSIRRKLLNGITLRDSDVSFLIIKLFDEYVDGVREHMEEEEKHLFKVVEALIAQTSLPEEEFPVYSHHHEDMSQKLKELKNIILKFCPSDSSAPLLNKALYDIYRCEEELGSHCKIEDNLLLPAIQNMRSKVSTQVRHKGKEGDEKETLSNREKEIISNVVKGLTNQEIADKLYLSVHTVMTHRKNIARKLQIHSATGLTIYAIVNNIVDLSEVKL